MTNDDFVTGVEYPEPFHAYALALCETASRYIYIMSPELDHRAFDHDDLVTALSAVARSSRQTEVRILISDSRKIVANGHRLLQLARRLPSTVHLQKLAQHPDWNGETIVIRDRNGVLYKPGGSDHQGFYEPDSRSSTLRHIELFEELWRYSIKDTELRTLHL